MKIARCILKIAAVVAAVAGVVCAVAANWDRIVDAFYTIADKLEEKKAGCCLASEEFDDFDDDAL